MKLITKAQMQKLTKNWNKDNLGEQKPVVKMFTPDAAATWLFVAASLQEEDNDIILYGIADVGLGFVEWGYVSFTELTSIRGKLGLPVERDRYTTFDKTMNEYYAAAYTGAGRPRLEV